MTGDAGDDAVGSVVEPAGPQPRLRQPRQIGHRIEVAFKVTELALLTEAGEDPLHTSLHCRIVLHGCFPLAAVGPRDAHRRSLAGSRKRHRWASVLQGDQLIANRVSQRRGTYPVSTPQLVLPPAWNRQRMTGDAVLVKADRQRVASPVKITRASEPGRS